MMRSIYATNTPYTIISAMTSITHSASLRRWSMVGISLLLVIAAALRLWRIDTLPPGFHFDESFEGLEAWRILIDPGYRPVFLTGNFGVPPLNAYANALMFGLFQLFGGEAGPTAMRTTAALFGVLGVLSVFALARELRALDDRADGLSAAFPLLAAGALAVMRWHVHFSRMGIEPVIVPLVWAAATWLFLRGWRTGSLLSYAGSGIVLAAGMYTYQGAWVIPFLMVPVVGVLLVQQRMKIEDSRLDRQGSGSQDRSGPPILNLQSSISRRFWGIAITTVVAFLLFLPLGIFFLRNWELVFLRPTQLAVMGETGSPADSSVWSSVWRTLAMFWPLGQTGDWDPRRNLPGAPALDVWLALPFFGGLALALWRMRRPAYSIVLIGWIGLLLPGMVSEYAPHFHRILGAAAPTALLIGMGLDWLWGRATLRRWRLHWLVPALLVLSLVTTARDYFVRWAALPDLYYAFDQGFWEIGQWSAQNPESTPRYISPRGEEHTTLAFAWRTLPADARPVTYDGRQIFPLTAATVDRAEEYIAIEHEDFRTRLLLPEVFPDATVVREFVDATGTVYARVYTRPPGSVPQRAPRNPAPAELGDGIRVAGYDLLPDTPRPGEIAYVQLHWLVDTPPTREWTVFVHLVSPDGTVVAGKDAPPGNGSLPTTHWQAGWRVLDEYQVALPADLSPDDYTLRAGLYAADGSRLPKDTPGVDLGVISVAP